MFSGRTIYVIAPLQLSEMTRVRIWNYVIVFQPLKTTQNPDLATIGKSCTGSLSLCDSISRTGGPLHLCLTLISSTLDNLVPKAFDKREDLTPFRLGDRQRRRRCAPECL